VFYRVRDRNGRDRIFPLCVLTAGIQVRRTLFRRVKKQRVFVCVFFYVQRPRYVCQEFNGRVTRTCRLRIDKHKWRISFGTFSSRGGSNACRHEKITAMNCSGTSAVEIKSVGIIGRRESFTFETTDCWPVPTVTTSAVAICTRTEFVIRIQ